MWKRFLSSYFSFTKKERTGILFLLVLITGLLIVPFLYPFFIKEKKYDHSQFEKEIAALQATSQDSGSFSKKNPGSEEENISSGNNNELAGKKGYNGSKAELFYFDPNTLDANGWERLGVKEKTIQTIQKYLSKGGKFYKPEDIGKIWGLPPLLVQQLIPYIKIEQVDIATEKQFTQPVYEKKEYKKEMVPVDINTADTTAFISLPGIGNKLANRIISYRDKLGGFYKIEQVGETFLLPDSVFQNIKSRLILTDPTVKQININTATLDELKTHPYIRYYAANAIIQYRTQHGNFSSVEEIKKIVLVTEDIFGKAAPYLKVSD